MSKRGERDIQEEPESLRLVSSFASLWPAAPAVQPHLLGRLASDGRSEVGGAARPYPGRFHSACGLDTCFVTRSVGEALV